MNVSIKETRFAEDKEILVLDESFGRKLDVSCLHEKELSLYARKNRRRKQEFLMGRFAVKYLAAREMDVPYEDIYVLNKEAGGQEGRPELYIGNELSDRFISISHDKGKVLAGIAEHCIGADVAVKRRNFAGWGALAYPGKAAGDTVTACLIWAMKEAFAKALGIGLRYGIHSVEICSIDWEKGIAGLELSRPVLPYITGYSDIYFEYEVEKEAAYVMCHLLKM